MATRSTGRKPAEATASNQDRGSGTPSGLTRTGWFASGPGRNAAEVTPRPTARPATAATGHHRRDGNRPSGNHKTPGEQRAEPTHPNPRRHPPCGKRPRKRPRPFDQAPLGIGVGRERDRGGQPAQAVQPAEPVAGQPGQDQRPGHRESQPEDDVRVHVLGEVAEPVPSHLAEPAEDQPKSHDPSRYSSHRPAGPGFRRHTHSLMVTVPGPAGKTSDDHTLTGTASGAASAATREVRCTPSRTLTTRIHSRQNRNGSALAARTCSPVTAVTTTAALPATTPPQPSVRPRVRVASAAPAAHATNIPVGNQSTTNAALPMSVSTRPIWGLMPSRRTYAANIGAADASFTAIAITPPASAAVAS